MDGSKVLREVKSSGSGRLRPGLQEVLYILVLMLKLVRKFPEESTVTKNFTNCTHIEILLIWMTN